MTPAILLGIIGESGLKSSSQAEAHLNEFTDIHVLCGVKALDDLAHHIVNKRWARAALALNIARARADSFVDQHMTAVDLMYSDLLAYPRQ